MTSREADTSPKESFVSHGPGMRGMGGMDGMGASDRLVLRDKDANSS